MGIVQFRKYAQSLLLPVVLIVVVAMAIGLFFVSPNMAQDNRDTTYRGPAVRVDGNTISDASFRSLLARQQEYYQQFQASGLNISAEVMRESALQSAISELVIANLIKKNKIKISNETLNLWFDRNIMQRYPDAEQRQSIYSSNGYKGEADFKDRAIRPYLEKQQLFVVLSKQGKIQTKVTEAEVRQAYAAAYHTVTVSHILFVTQQGQPGAMTEAEAKQKADEVYAKLKAGADWNEMVKQYSGDTGTKDNRGSLGTMTPDEMKQRMVPAFATAALALKAGETSAPVKSEYGYHIIRMDAREGSYGAQYKKLYELVKAETLAQKFGNDQTQYQDWLNGEIADAKVEILDPALQAYRLKGQEDWANAAKYYEKAIRKRANRWQRDILLSALEVFQHEKMYDKVISYGQKFEKRFEGDIDINGYIVQAYYAQAKSGDKAKAKTLLTTMRDAAGGDPAALTKILQIYRALNAKELKKDQDALQAKVDQLAAQALQQSQNAQPAPELSLTPDGQTGAGGQ